MVGDLPDPPAENADRGRAVLAELLAAPPAADADANAGRLIYQFGSLAAALAASPERLEAVAGREAAQRLDVVRRVLIQSLMPRPLAEPVLPSTSALIGYLRLLLAEEPVEQLRVLFLDTRQRLLRNELLAKGSPTAAACDPRAILRRALEVGAAGLVLVHNHPSGDPMPSARDIEATRAVAHGAGSFGIELLDHLIVGRAGVISLRALGYLPDTISAEAS